MRPASTLLGKRPWANPAKYRNLTRKEFNSKYFIFQTNDLDVALNETISPQGKTNPGLTDRVCLWKGFPSAPDYGVFQVIIPAEEISVVRHNPPEWASFGTIPATLGEVMHWNDLSKMEQAMRKL